MFVLPAICHFDLSISHLTQGSTFTHQVQQLLWLPINQNLQHLLWDFLVLKALCGFLKCLFKNITNYINEHKFLLSKLHTPLSQLFSQEQLRVTYSRPEGRTFQRIKDTWDPDTTITSHQKALQTYPKGLLHFTCPKLFFLSHCSPRNEAAQAHPAASPQILSWPLSPALGDPTLWAALSHFQPPKTPIALFWIREFNNLNIL